MRGEGISSRAIVNADTHAHFVAEDADVRRAVERCMMVVKVLLSAVEYVVYWHADPLSDNRDCDRSNFAAWIGHVTP